MEWKHKKESKWLIVENRKVHCYLCGRKMLKASQRIYDAESGHYSHAICEKEKQLTGTNERRSAVKKIVAGAGVLGLTAVGVDKFTNFGRMSNSVFSSNAKDQTVNPELETVITSQGIILPSLTSDPANPVAGQMWYRSDAGVTAHFDSIQNRVVYSSEINNGNVNVTSKGIINGLSVLPNDGTGGFGPDTTLDATSIGQIGSPYTQTVGIGEAIPYAITNQIGVIRLFSGTYDVTNASLHTDPISGQQYKIYIPSNPNTSPTVNLSIISDVFTKPGFGGVTSTSVCGAVIQSLDIVSATNTSTAFIFGAFTYSDSQGGSNVNLYIDGIGFQTNESSSNYLGGIDVHNAISCSFGLLSLNTNYSGESPSTYNSATGIYWMTGGVQNAQIYGGSIAITGYKWGMLSDLPHTHISQLTFYYCYVGLLTYSGTKYGGNISYFEAQVTPFGLQVQTDPISLHIGVYNQGDQASTGTFAYNSSIYTQSAAVVVADVYNIGTSGITPNFPVYTGSRVVIKSWGINTDGTEPYSPTVTISANPPVSGTVYQNTNPYAIEIDLPVYATTSGTAGYVTIAKGSTDTPTAIGNQYVSGDTSSTATQIIRVRVPAGWYYEFTGSGVTFGTATPFAE